MIHSFGCTYYLAFDYRLRLKWQNPIEIMRILRYTFRNIVRNPLLSISSIFVIALLIFFVNVLLLVLFASERFIDSVNGRISFTISFQSGYTVQDANVRGLAARLQDTFTGISIDPISKREALSLMKERNPDLVSLIENTWENPLPESLRIDNIPLDQYEDFDAIISEQKEILYYDKDSMNKKLLDYKSQFSRALVVVDLLQYVQYWVYALLSLFLFTVAVIIYTVIGNSIFFHRQEIEIIELVGGKSSYIYWPFLLQGAIYGFAATIVSGLFVFLLSRLMPLEFVSWPLTALHTQIDAGFPRTFVLEMLIFFFLGLLSALVALRRYVRT